MSAENISSYIFDDSITSKYKRELKSISISNLNDDILCNSEKEIERFANLKGFNSTEMKDLLNKWFNTKNDILNDLKEVGKIIQKELFPIYNWQSQ